MSLEVIKKLLLLEAGMKLHLTGNRLDAEFIHYLLKLRNCHVGNTYMPDKPLIHNSLYRIKHATLPTLPALVLANQVLTQPMP